MGLLRCSRIIRSELGMFLTLLFVTVEAAFGLSLLMLGFEFRVRLWKFSTLARSLWEAAFARVVTMKRAFQGVCKIG